MVVASNTPLNHIPYTPQTNKLSTHRQAVLLLASMALARPAEDAPKPLVYGLPYGALVSAPSNLNDAVIEDTICAMILFKFV